MPLYLTRFSYTPATWAKLFRTLRTAERITAQGIDTALIDPGKPGQNGAGESFNGKFRDECLSLEWFCHAPRPRR